MHLLEALLGLWECSGGDRYLARAGVLCDLFAKRFFRADPGILGEYFTATLAPAPGIAGQIVEPGHHYERVWLLRRYERADGQPMQLYVDALYAHADRFGFDEEGLIVDELLVDGSPHRLARQARCGRQLHRRLHACQHALPPGRGSRRVAAQRSWPWSRCDRIGS